jgi:hypothetical protein
MSVAAKISERQISDEDLPFVDAVVNYSADVPRHYADVQNPVNTFRPLEPHTVRIKDARPIRDQLDLEKQGFMLMDHVSRVSHLRDEKYIDGIYHQEIGEIFYKLSGCDFILPYRKILQVRLSQRAPGENGNDYTRPASFVHVDYTQYSFNDVIRWVQKENNMRVRTDYSRVVLYQCWRAVSKPPHDFPIAMTDGRSVKPGEWVIMDNLIGPKEIDGNYIETRIGKYSPNHSWYYFSDMRADELLLFKGNDTKWGDNQNVLHTGFDNTAKHPNASYRESIETRFLGFWE